MKCFALWAALCCLQTAAAQCALSSEQKTVPAGLDFNDQLGRAVDVHLSLAASGAPFDENIDGVSTGAVYVEQKIGGFWQVTQALYPSVGDAGDLFGASVAISAQYIAVGAPNSNLFGSFSGAVYIFQRQSNGQYIETQILEADNVLDYFRMGTSLAISSSSLLVGIPQTTGSLPGQARMFELNNGVWEYMQHLNQGNVPVGSQYGSSVDLEGDFAIVGAPLRNGNTDHEGEAHVYIFNGTQFVLDQVLVPSNPQTQGRFGTDVAITDLMQLVVSGHCALNGNDQCALYVHNGLDWMESDLAEVAGLDYDYGVAVDMVGNQVVVGVPGYDDGDLGNTGAVYVYDVSEGMLDQTQTIKASDRSGHDGFGNAVDIWNNRLVVGASKEDQFSPDQGAVYHYSCNLVGGIGGCTNPCALNYNAQADYEDGSCAQYCAEVCPGDVNGDGGVDVNDLVMILGLFGVECD